MRRFFLASSTRHGRIARPRRGRIGMRHPASILAAPLLALAGCVVGPVPVVADVSSWGQWPAGRAPGSYTFERLPSQQDDPGRAVALEAAARGAVERAGFTPAADQASADVKMQVGVRVLRTVVEAWPDPYWRDPFWPGPWVGPGVAWGLGWGWPVHGASLSLGFYGAPAYAQYEREVALIMRDGRTHQVLYETHARYDSRRGGDDLLSALFDAALRDFPNGMGRRQVTVWPGAPAGAPARRPGEPVGVPAVPAAPAAPAASAP